MTKEKNSLNDRLRVNAKVHTIIAFTLIHFEKLL